jgi:hypothetical protein
VWDSPPLAALAWLNCVLYIVSSCIIIYLFWKTHDHFRVETVQSCHAAPDGDRTTSSLLLLPRKSQCMMCEFGMCLDNDHRTSL